MHITDLTPGMEVYGWLKLGLALKVAVQGDGSPHYQVPTKPRRARAGDITRFVGTVSRNDASNRVLTLNVTPVNSQGKSYGSGLSVDIAYSAFQRLRLISAYSHIPVQPIASTAAGKGWKRPGSINSATSKKPYRLVTEVKL